MAKLSFDGWKDPARRARYIIWTGAAAVLLVAFMLVTLGVTSSYWFCANGCHKVQDDTITAYDASSHSEINCMACHMPVNSSPVTFMLHKVEALGELYLTVTNSYEIPLNGHSHVSLTEMSSDHCTQCHNLQNRAITPKVGVLIDHDVHAEEDVDCALCHNRIAHKETDMEFENVDPKSGEINRGHDNFMSMQACFRCHWLSEDDRPSEIKAPGDCAACHPKDFELKPASHREDAWFPEGHTKAAEEASESVAEAKKEASAAPMPEGEGVGSKLPPVETINECQTCHTTSFCTNCHGTPMPHSPEFIRPPTADDPDGHPTIAAKDSQMCEKCHPGKQEFCNTCHHGSAMKVEYDATKEWIPNHQFTVKKVGAQACFECHDPTYCADCHVNLAKKGLIGN
jgi:nitrate/TMAO reductase-like tetraheme cytochrome c subunit